jgi:hypothetical protein
MTTLEAALSLGTSVPSIWHLTCISRAAPSKELAVSVSRSLRCEHTYRLHMTASAAAGLCQVVSGRACGEAFTLLDPFEA